MGRNSRQVIYESLTTIPIDQTAVPGPGTVSSVALTAPSIMSVSGSPVTSSGTLGLTLATQTANTVFSGPTSGGAATPTFRALVAADIPSLSGTYQPLDATLTALAGLTIAADSLTIGTGADAFNQTTFAANTFPARASTGSLVAKTITDFALTILDDADAASVRATIGAGTGGGSVTSVGFTGGLIAVATATTTPAFTVAGTSGGGVYFSSTSTWASTALLAANAIMIGGGAGAAYATTTTGTGVLTALGVNTGTAGAFVVNGGALGTPSSGTLTNCTFPTLNQNTSGSAATLTTTRTIWGQNFNGSANVSGTLALGVSDLTLTGSIGATGARATKVWTAALESTAMPTVGGTSLSSTFSAIAGSASIVTVGTITSGTWNGTDIAVADGGTGRSTSTTAYGLIAAGTTATGAHQTLAAGATTEILVGGGASALPVWTTATGSGSPVRATSPTLVTPVLGTPSSGTLTSCTGLPIATGLSGLGASGRIPYATSTTALATSANLRFEGANRLIINNLDLNAVVNLSVSAGAANSYIWNGQDTSHNVQMNWIYNATAGNAHGAIETYGYSNPLKINASVIHLSDSSAGNVKIGGTANRGTTEGTNQLAIFNGTAPVGTLTNGASFYAASGEMRVMDSAGNSTLLSPHDKDGNWIHDEINYKGRRLRVDMERMVKALDKLLGGGFVQEFLIDK